MMIKRIVNFVFGLFKINNRKILFQCGRDMVDGSPKALYDFMRENCPNDYILKWIVSKDTDVSQLSKDDFVYTKSISSLFHTATAKYWIRSESIGSLIIKRKKQVYIQTWHGHGALKKMGYDITNAKERPPVDHVKEWDYLLVLDTLEEKIMKSSTGYIGKNVMVGIPAMDSILKKANNMDYIKNIKKQLNLSSNKKIALYAPTFRESDLSADIVNIPIKQLSLLKDYIFLVRLHPLVNKKVDTSIFSDNIINACQYPDASDLLIIADVLISDYSSIIYEYSLLNKPILFYAYDLKLYEKERGFDLDYQKDLPGPIAYSEEKLCELLKKNSSIEKDYKDKLDVFNKKFNYLNDGQACKRITEMLKNGYFK